MGAITPISSINYLSQLEMKLFRVDKNQPFTGPHQGQNLYQAGADPKNAKAAMIMIHGRGATPQSIITLTQEINKSNEITFLPHKLRDLPGIHFLF